MRITLTVSRRSLLTAVVAGVCLAAPALDVDARLGDGARAVARHASEDCWLARTGSDVVVRIEAIEGAAKTCSSVVTTGAQQGWVELEEPVSRLGDAPPVCGLTRGRSVWAATARVYGGDAAATCTGMADEGWEDAPRSSAAHEG